MEVVALEAPDEHLHYAKFAHLFLNGGVAADVEKDVEADVEELVLLPDEHVEFFELGTGSDAVVLVIAAPHFDVLAVHQVEPLDLVLEHFHDRQAHLVLRQQVLELAVVGQYVKHGQDVDAQVDVAFVVFAQSATQDGQQAV